MCLIWNLFYIGNAFFPIKKAYAKHKAVLRVHWGDLFMEYDALKQPDRITHEYNMLMSSMHVSVGKHLLDPYFTVIWANDFFYERLCHNKWLIFDEK